MVSSIGFYFGAHQDDALLFRGEFLRSDAGTPDARVVHVVTTAGDAGLEAYWWRAREKGLIDAHKRAHAADPSGVKRRFGGKNVTVYDAGKWAVYCLRLPDGNIGGGGFPRTGHASLVKLRDGRINRMQAVDGDAASVYTSWSDFRNTLRAIVDQEMSAARLRPPQWVNTSDYLAANNPNDHTDHYATSQAVRDVVGGAYHRVHWVSYDTEHRPANLGDPQLTWKRDLFYAYAHAVSRDTGTGIGYFDAEWNRWGNKSYWREQRAGRTTEDQPEQPEQQAPEPTAT
ncbi:PIG-L family deacetylase [Saccharopolyspora sp. CA-218241]|uniref:PIG-L family deacetylase n=1 Tax=Saccharopolyspora sp. CA-218241 TaxID=3240027 RepID=UPI003D9613B9